MSVEGPAEFRTKIIKLIQQATLNPSTAQRLLDEVPVSSDFACFMVPIADGGKFLKNTYHIEAPVTLTSSQAIVLAEIIELQRINSIKFIYEKRGTDYTTFHYGPGYIQGGLEIPNLSYQKPVRPNISNAIVPCFDRYIKESYGAQTIDPLAEQKIKDAFKRIQPIKEDLERHVRFANLDYEIGLHDMGQDPKGLVDNIHSKRHRKSVAHIRFSELIGLITNDPAAIGYSFGAIRRSYSPKPSSVDEYERPDYPKP